MKHDEATTTHSETSMMDIMHQMNKKMDSVQMTKNVDHDFAELMIIHHQAAIDMAQLEIDSGDDASLKKLAQKIIEAQTKEIEDLRLLLKKQH